MPCEDDEDLCEPGSGSPGDHGVFPESNPLDSKFRVIELGYDHLYCFPFTFLFAI